MATADIIHDAVKNALIKDGWAITHDPYVKKAIQLIVQRYKLPLLIVDIEKEEIVKWTKPPNIAS